MSSVQLAGSLEVLPGETPTLERRITWLLWAVWQDGSRSLLDMIDWEPGYDGTARQAWRYAWGAFRASARMPEALGATRIDYSTVGRG